MDIYQEVVLYHYKNSPFRGHLKNPTHQSRGINPSCGDVINFELFIKDGKIKDIRFFGHGCVISQASASLICQHLKNKETQEIEKLDKNLVLKLLGINLGPNRLKCAILPMEVVKKLNQQ